MFLRGFRPVSATDFFFNSPISWLHPIVSSNGIVQHSLTANEFLGRFRIRPEESQRGLEGDRIEVLQVFQVDDWLDCLLMKRVELGELSFFEMVHIWLHVGAHDWRMCGLTS